MTNKGVFFTTTRSGGIREMRQRTDEVTRRNEVH